MNNHINLKQEIINIFQTENYIVFKQITEKIRNLISKKGIDFSKEKVPKLVQNTFWDFKKENPQIKFDYIVRGEYIKVKKEYIPSFFAKKLFEEIINHFLKNKNFIFEMSKIETELKNISKDPSLIHQYNDHILIAESINSSTIEGNTIQNLDEYNIRKKNDPERQSIDKLMELYTTAQNDVMQTFNTKSLTSFYIRECHQFIFNNIKKDDYKIYSADPKTIGAFKKIQNYIGSGFKPCAPENVVYEVEKFVRIYNFKPLSFTEAFIRASILHLYFEAIHPFSDGNGRLGRFLFTNYFLQHGFYSKTLITISNNNMKKNYIRCLYENDVSGLINLFAEIVIDNITQ